MVAFAETTNNSIAARRFSIHEKQVREWRKKKNALSEMPKAKKAARDRPPMYPELEEKLASWVEESRSEGLIITHTAIYLRVLFELFCII